MHVAVETFPLANPFRISGYVFTESAVVVITLSDGEYIGRGEASGVYYLNDDVKNMITVIDRSRSAIEGGATREDLLALMPAGGGRNAVDAALWELEARRSGTPVWHSQDSTPRAGFSPPSRSAPRSPRSWPAGPASIRMLAR